MHTVTKNFGGRAILKNISFQVKKGERISLVGPGGCGKTTILKLLLGLLAPDKGDIQILQTSIFDCSQAERTNLMRAVGMAFQQGGLFDFMTVRENLIFAMEHMTQKSKEEMEQKIKSLLAAVKLSSTEHLYPHELSGGMKRRVGIARALCTDPQLAIFDEPTSGLDPVTSTIILKMILDLASSRQDICLLVATSNVEIAVRFADRVVLINNGEVVADGPWRDLLLEGPPWVKHFLGVRFIGLDLSYAQELSLPEKFIKKHWNL